MHYRNDNLLIDLDGLALRVFGFSDYGLFVEGANQISVLTPAHELMPASTNMSSFVRTFHAFVALALNPASQISADAFVANLGEEDPLIANPHGFWLDATNVLIESGGGVCYSLLSWLKDNKIPSS